MSRTSCVVSAAAEEGRDHSKRAATGSAMQDAQVLVERINLSQASGHQGIYRATSPKASAVAMRHQARASEHNDMHGLFDLYSRAGTRSDKTSEEYLNVSAKKSTVWNLDALRDHLVHAQAATINGREVA
ncbi:uncharacterized protein PV09_07037 [Verruconis gallopava]|uniref:Uncharacterized protein n=1 Tax=Verruconis gallopava TaxID=253628 RepID=A0A0D1XH72_9PEZI|nr:uncharacterized protein PV09_07037 [Verruconis gallopava]KIW01561.1 hypothetical protein PV09_07037 [Verruconis gallopava]